MASVEKNSPRTRTEPDTRSGPSCQSGMPAVKSPRQFSNFVFWPETGSAGSQVSR